MTLIFIQHLKGMAHEQQQRFCCIVRALFPEYFAGTRVLDVGSMDINGSNRPLFWGCDYTGIDIGPGRNVDYALGGHHWFPGGKPYDVVISTECGEHDKYYKATIANMMGNLRPGGLMIYTCATTGRPEHGTTRTSQWESPYTTDYYKNLTRADLEAIPHFKEGWECCRFTVNEQSHDLQFWGIKKSYGYRYTWIEFKPRLGYFILTYFIFFYHRRMHDFSNAFKKILKWIRQ